MKLQGITGTPSAGPMVARTWSGCLSAVLWAALWSARSALTTSGLQLRAHDTSSGTPGANTV